MVGERSHLQPVEADPSHSGGGGGGSAGGGDLVDYRLAELERRVGKLEESVSDIRASVSAMKQQMTNLATKYTVAFWMVGAVVVNFLALVGHLLVRSLGGA